MNKVDAFYSTNLQPHFESHGGRLEAFDDGHCPETYHINHNHHLSNNVDDESNSDATSSPRIVKYDQHPTATTSSVHVYDNVLDPNIARMLYNVTNSSSSSSSITSPDDTDKPSSSALALEGESPWGCYVTIAEARRWIEWNANAVENNIWSNDCCHFGDSYEGYTIAWKRRMLRYYHCRDIHHDDDDDGKVRDYSSDEKNDPRDYTDLHKKQHQQLDNMDCIRHALAVEAVASFLLEIVPNRAGTTAAAAMSRNDRSSHNAVDEKLNTATATTLTSTIYQIEDIFEHAHGVAVWALSSKPGNSVSYHIDYAELLRYEYNVTVPPLYAGTIQCSPLIHANAATTTTAIESNDCIRDKEVEETYGIMRGGEFCVNLGGLDHYVEHGYKGKCSGDIFGGWKRPSTNDNIVMHSRNNVLHVNDHDQWVTIPYSFNRGIIHNGDLPHLSAPIDSISATTPNNSVTRVVVGFNVFGHDVGPNVSKAPEHSKQFRRKVRLYRSAINACRTKDSNSLGAACKLHGGGMDISRVRQNKGLTKLLVLAKREKVKEELRINQDRLSYNIRKRLLWNHKHGKSLLCVADIMNEFGAVNDKLDCSWPKSVDVHVHLHHMLSPASNTSDNTFLDIDGTLSQSKTSYYCIVRASVLDLESSLDSHQLGLENSRCSLISPSTYLDVLKCTRVVNDRSNNDK